MLDITGSSMIECEKCQHGINLSWGMELCNGSKLSDTYSCQKCDCYFTYFDGIINAYCSENIFSQLNFISDIIETGTSSIEIGKSIKVNVSKTFHLVHKVILTPVGKGAILNFIADQDSDYFVLTSSAFINSNTSSGVASVGDTINVNWTLYGSSSGFQIETWKSIVNQSKTRYTDGDYLSSYLNSAIALESYLNYLISHALKNKGLDETSIEIMLKESSMPEKLFKLLDSLVSIKPNELGLSKTRATKILMKRNKIAHGMTAEMDKQTAKDAFRFVVEFIMKIENEINET